MNIVSINSKSARTTLWKISTQSQRWKATSPPILKNVTQSKRRCFTDFHFHFFFHLTVYLSLCSAHGTLYFLLLQIPQQREHQASMKQRVISPGDSLTFKKADLWLDGLWFEFRKKQKCLWENVLHRFPWAGRWSAASKSGWLAAQTFQHAYPITKALNHPWSHVPWWQSGVSCENLADVETKDAPD